jgi:hypothetical protein
MGQKFTAGLLGTFCGARSGAYAARTFSPVGRVYDAGSLNVSSMWSARMTGSAEPDV